MKVDDLVLLKEEIAQYDKKKFFSVVSEEKEIKVIEKRKTSSAVFWDKLHALMSCHSFSGSPVNK